MNNLLDLRVLFVLFLFLLDPRTPKLHILLDPSGLLSMKNARNGLQWKYNEIYIKLLLVWKETSHYFN